MIKDVYNITLLIVTFVFKIMFFKNIDIYAQPADYQLYTYYFYL